ncbi:MAG: DNA gyrase subunit A [Myxococcota bacterium]
MLRDIDRETVDFQPNFDGQMEEPIVPPTRSNLLANGSSGTPSAWRRTSRPTTCASRTAAPILEAENPDCGLDDLLAKMPGPDFPTGGQPAGLDGIRAYYATGRGHPALRARAGFEPYKRGIRIVVTEIPYQVNTDAARADRRSRARGPHPGHRRPARRVEPRRHADRDRAQEGRGRRT